MHRRQQFQRDTIIELGVNTPSSTQGFYVDKATSDKYNLKQC